MAWGGWVSPSNASDRWIFFQKLEQGLKRGCGVTGRVDDAVAFGDGGNDAELLAVVGHGVAMTDAPDWLRARADDVAASNSEAGVRA